MEVEKASSKSSSFFKIFDWGKKPKRKLFASSPDYDKITYGKEAIDNVSSSKTNVVEDDDAVVMSSIRGTSECSSSVTEEEGIIKRPPGVVARLMGLDSIPISMHSDSLSPPLQLSLQKRPELRPHKMPSSPIERFQTEMIPPKMGKTIPVSRYKPLSPIKSSTFVSGRNATQIMEVASRIIEPGLHSAPMRVYDSGSLVRRNPKPVNRRLNVLEGGGDLNGAKGKRKTTVPINQGRTNISKRDGTANNSRTNNQKKTVPVQNNRKQNTLGTKNGTQRLLNGEINNAGDASFGKNRVSNHSKGTRDSKMAKKTNSRTRKLNTISEASQVTSHNNINHSNILVRRSERHIDHNLVVDSQLKSNVSIKKVGANGINTSNIVSFTFTSPVDKLQKNRGLKADLSHMDVIDGDYLGILLEQKLRELTCGSGSPYKRSLNMIATRRSEAELLSSIKSDNGIFLNESKSSLPSGGHEMKKEMEREMETSVSAKEPDQENSLSPFSTLEALPSMESCNSSESWDSSKGIKSCTSFRFNEVLEVEDESSISESDYSLATTNDLPSSEIADTAISCGSTHNDSPELSLIEEIINSLDITEVYCNGLHINEQEEKEDERNVKICRKLLIGCVREFLEATCEYYFKSGYSRWSRGYLYIGKLSAEKLFKEIVVEKGVDEEGMVDLLVNADMSYQLGTWVDFEIESFESGAEIQRDVLDSLIDELVADLL